MSVLIKGMEMPENCEACRFAGLGGRFCELHVCMFTGESQPTLNQKRMSSCPLIPVPPHGRLIDADALAKKMRGVVFREEEKDVLHHNVQAFLDAPTIIEAEEGE